MSEGSAIVQLKAVSLIHCPAKGSDIDQMKAVVWFGLLGFNASATARVISRRWNDDDEIIFWWRKPEYPEETAGLWQTTD